VVAVGGGVGIWLGTAIRAYDLENLESARPSKSFEKGGWWESIRMAVREKRKTGGEDAGSYGNRSTEGGGGGGKVTFILEKTANQDS